MITNGHYLLQAAPILNMESTKQTGPGGTSWGFSEAGYDIRIKQSVLFTAGGPSGLMHVAIGDTPESCVLFDKGRFALASAIEQFQMPNWLTGIVHDKSTWARRGLSVFNTVIEPGFCGGLTLELVYHGNTELIIPAGAGIAQVMFHEIRQPAEYRGKYQHQSNNPEPARDS